MIGPRSPSQFPQQGGDLNLDLPNLSLIQQTVLLSKAAPKTNSVVQPDQGRPATAVGHIFQDLEL